ncbi:MAG: hypothetical protein HQ518_18900 [Rhodopirellula sp.]|nr:hypothetical protein [Rhodopirellula sp.]
MELRQRFGGSQAACPECRTRLRLSIQAGGQTDFVCPECNAALTAHSTQNGTVEISTVENASTSDSLTSSPLPSGPSAQATLQRYRKLFSNSRAIAAVVTVSLGMILAIFLLPSVGEPDHRPAQVASSPDANSDGSAVASADVTDQAVADNTIAARRHAIADEVPAEADATSDSQATVANLSQPSVELVPPSLDISQPAHKSDAVQLIAGTEEISSSDSQLTLGNRHESQEASLPKELISTPPDETTAKPMSVRERLAISIRSYRQTKPVSLHGVIRTVEQMCRVRVDVSAVSNAQLEKEITLSLQATTPAAVLDAAGRKCGLLAIVDETSVRMISAEE